MHVQSNLYLAIYPLCKIGSSCNVYAIRTEEGVILIDGGNEPDIPVIEERLNLFGMRVEDIKLLIATHCHFDHFETFGALRKRSGAKVLAHAKDADAMEAGDDRTGWRVRAVFGLRPTSFPVPVDRRLEDGEHIRLGSADLEVVHTPGHTDGSICLYASFDGKKALFVGDVIMPKAQGGGAIGWVGSPTFDVAAYRSSLERMAGMDVDWLLAGHENLCLKDGWRIVSQTLNRFMIDYPVSR